MSIRFARRVDEIRRVVWTGDDAVDADGAPALVELECVRLKPGRKLDELDIFEIHGLGQQDADVLFGYAGQTDADLHALAPAIALFLLSHGVSGINSNGVRVDERVKIVDELCNAYPATVRAALVEAVYRLTVGGDLADRPFRSRGDVQGGGPVGAAARATV